ncbi:MAG: hypothetical protein AB7F40_10230 [Victivallaceae bacterium]
MPEEKMGMLFETTDGISDEKAAEMEEFFYNALQNLLEDLEMAKQISDKQTDQNNAKKIFTMLSLLSMATLESRKEEFFRTRK